jgi:general stress protein YciG
MATNNIKKRGFASMDKERMHEIVRKAGKKAHALGKAHKFTKEEAQKAGRKGGIANFHKAYEKRLRLIQSIKDED